MSIENTPKSEENLPTSVAEVIGRKLNLGDDYNYTKAAKSDSEGREVSEDAFVRIIQSMVEWLKDGENRQVIERNNYSVMSRILDRESMRNHPDIALFRKAVEEIAELDGYELERESEDSEEAE